MSVFEKVSAIISLSTLFIALLAAYVAFRQVKIFGAIEPRKILHESDAEAARIHYFFHLKGKDFANWDEVDFKAAQKICASYDSVGTLLLSGYGHRRLILKSYGSSIQKTYIGLKSYRAKIIEDTGNDRYYFEGYDWLFRESRRLHRIPF